jgi:hypothetical protein
MALVTLARSTPGVTPHEGPLDDVGGFPNIAIRRAWTHVPIPDFQAFQ